MLRLGSARKPYLHNAFATASVPPHSSAASFVSRLRDWLGIAGVGRGAGEGEVGALQRRPGPLEPVEADALVDGPAGEPVQGQRDVVGREFGEAVGAGRAAQAIGRGERKRLR